MVARRVRHRCRQRGRRDVERGVASSARKNVARAPTVARRVRREEQWAFEKVRERDGAKLRTKIDSNGLFPRHGREQPSFEEVQRSCLTAILVQSVDPHHDQIIGQRARGEIDVYEERTEVRSIDPVDDSRLDVRDLDRIGRRRAGGREAGEWRPPFELQLPTGREGDRIRDDDLVLLVRIERRRRFELENPTVIAGRAESRGAHGETRAAREVRSTGLTHAEVDVRARRLDAVLGAGLGEDQVDVRLLEPIPPVVHRQRRQDLAVLDVVGLVRGKRRDDLLAAASEAHAVRVPQLGIDDDLVGLGLRRVERRVRSDDDHATAEQEVVARRDRRRTATATTGIGVGVLQPDEQGRRGARRCDGGLGNRLVELHDDRHRARPSIALREDGGDLGATIETRPPRPHHLDRGRGRTATRPALRIEGPTDVVATGQGEQGAGEGHTEGGGPWVWVETGDCHEGYGWPDGCR